LTKKRQEKPRREITKRQLARWQEQRRRQRILFGLGISIIAAVLVIVGAGWYISQYQPLHQTVVSVNETRFNMDYYIKALRFYGGGQPSYMYGIADQVITVIQRNELIRQEAMKLGIDVSQKEVDEELKSRDPPLKKDYRDFIRAEMLIDKLQDEYFEQEVPVYAEQRHIMAMLLESESQVAEVRDRIGAGQEFADLAGELSLESLSKEENGDLDWRPKGILTILLGTSAIDEYAFSSEVGVLSQPIYDEELIKGVGYWVAKVLAREEKPEKAKVLGILLGSEEAAQNVRDRLEAGEDFGELAEELSEDEASKEDGGDLGWWTPGEAGAAFDEFVFNPEIELGVVSEPILDDTIAIEGGYWLIKVLERKEKKETADVQVILLGSEKEAQEVRARLEAGEDFGELAKELSQHVESKEDGGEVAGVTPDMMNSALSEFVFNSWVELETVSEPIRDDTVFTEGGYWLIKVIDKDDNRQLEDDDRKLLKAEAFTKWVEALRNDPENKIESYLDDEKKAWAIEKAMSS
jgi:parvulin-like peptidyl-prolyl isomerase